MPTAVQNSAKALYDLLGLYGCNCASQTLASLTSNFQDNWLTAGGAAGVKANGRFDPATRYALATTLDLSNTAVPQACYSPQNDGSGPCDTPVQSPLPFPHLPLPLPLPVHLPHPPSPAPPMAPAPLPTPPAPLPPALPAPPAQPPPVALPAPAPTPAGPSATTLLFAALSAFAVGFGVVYTVRAT